MADEVNAAENVAETEEQIHYPLHVQYCGGNIVNLRSGESFLEGICAYWIDFFCLTFHGHLFRCGAVCTMPLEVRFLT